MSDLRLGFPFSSGMVLQRDRTNLIWGKDRAGQELEIALTSASERRTARTIADETGAFELSLPPLPAGGPYRLVVEGSSVVTIDDVLVGEVWLCSGQSNMEWPVSASSDADATIEAAGDPLLRVIKVRTQTAWEPSASASGSWEPASPEYVARFTAVGYSFARELREHLGVPVGIIDATWGGTTIAAWTSEAALRALDGTIDEKLATLRSQQPDEPRIRREFAEQMATWERASLPADPPHTGVDRGFASIDFDDSAWQSMNLPGLWQHRGMEFNGVVWFRRQVEIPAAWAGRELTLGLGNIDDFDHTYFNGELVGAHAKGTPAACTISRSYVVPAHLVKAGRAVVAVRVFDHVGEGGFLGPRREMTLAPSDASGSPSNGASPDAIALSGPWRLFAEYPIPLVPGSVWQTYPNPPLLLTPQHRPAALHNGMIAPVAPYGIRGVLWYQGESDVWRYAEYDRAQSALARDLRAHFRQGTLPFLFVELAGFEADGNWALFREAQQRATAEPGMALVTARDIGDANDIHPRNKREVGRRLALVAQKRVYGLDVDATFPRFSRMEVDGGAARVWFDCAAPLTTPTGSAALVGFEIAGADGQYHSAEATLEWDHVLVQSLRVPHPVHVRYAFTDTGEGNLVSQSGLPALSFRTDGHLS